MSDASWKEQTVVIPIPDADLTLEGAWQAGDAGGAVIAPPHPEYGGSLDNPVVHQIAHGLFRAGLASLRFNWRGVGASQGAVTGDTNSAEVDFAGALDQLCETSGTNVVAAGYSFGAATALRIAANDRRVRRVLLVAPPVQMLAGIALEELRRPVRIAVGDRDAFAPLGELEPLVSRIPDATLDVVAGADHFFSVGLSELSGWAARSSKA